MRVYRLGKARYRATQLSGDGGLVVDGRWHSAGRRIVYTASSEALCVLEVRVHLGSVLPGDPFEISVIELPDELLADLTPAALPAGWNDVPPGAPSQGVGDAWLAAGTSAALRVPSIHSASDHSILLNPAHPLAGRAELVASREYRFDSRLFAR